MRVILTTGGTGGHIYPALALTTEIMKDPHAEVLFIGSQDRMEAKLIPEAGYRFIGLNLQGFNGNSHDKLQALKLNREARKECLKIIQEFKPQVIVGFGNYVTVPVIQAGKKLGIPCVIHEQNSLPGLANRYLSLLATKVITSYPQTEKYFPASKVELLGNPRASQACRQKKDPNVIKQLGLDPNKKTVLIVMGSLGSHSVNKVMVETLQLLGNKDFQIIDVTGEDDYQDLSSKVPPYSNIKILPYCDQLSLMANSDLIVCRGGATSASEIMAIGLPSIIIPSPYVPNNHQHYNALAMVNAGCAYELPEQELTAASLVELIQRLIYDDKGLAEVRKKAEELGFPLAVHKFVALLKHLTGETYE